MQSLLVYTLEAGFYSYSQEGMLSLFEPDLSMPLTRPMFIGRAATALEEKVCVGGDYTSLRPDIEGEHVMGSAWIVEFMPRVSCLGDKIVFPKARGEISREHGAFDVRSAEKNIGWNYVHRSQSQSQSALWAPGEGIVQKVSSRGEIVSMNFIKEGNSKNILLFGYLESYMQNPKPIPYKSGYVAITQRDMRTHGSRSLVYELPLNPKKK